MKTACSVGIDTGTRGTENFDAFDGLAATVATWKAVDLVVAYFHPELGVVVVDEQHRFGVVQRDELARRAAALDAPVHQRGDAGGIVAAIFQPLQRLQNDARAVLGARNADDAAH